MVKQTDAKGVSKKTWILLGVVTAGAILALILALTPTTGQVGVASDLKPMLDTSPAVVSRASDLVSAGQVEQAIELLKAYVQENPGDIMVRPFLARLFLQQNQIGDAAGQVDAILAVAPDNAKALWLKGMIAAIKGQDSMQYFTKAATQQNAGVEIWKLYGLLMVDKGKFDEARKYLEKAAKIMPEDGELDMALGQVAFEQDDVKQAETYLNAAVRKMPRNARAWALLSELQKNIGQTEQAFKSIQRGMAYAQGKDRGPMLAQLGQMLIIRKEWHVAAEVFVRATEYDDVRPEACLNAAKCFYFANKIPHAERYILEARVLMPDDSRVETWSKKIKKALVKPTEAKLPSDKSILKTNFQIEQLR